MKKFLSIVLALVMMMALALPAFAKEYEVDNRSVYFDNVLREHSDDENLGIKFLGPVSVNLWREKLEALSVDLNGYEFRCVPSIDKEFGIRLFKIFDSSNTYAKFDYMSSYIIIKNSMIFKDITIPNISISNYGVFIAENIKIEKDPKYADKLLSVYNYGGVVYLSKIPQFQYSAKNSDDVLYMDKDVDITYRTNSATGEIINPGRRVIVNLNGGTLDVAALKKAKEDKEFPIPVKGEDYVFVEWVDKNGKTVTLADVPASSEIEIEAVYKAKIQIKVDANGGNCDVKTLDGIDDGKLIDGLPYAELDGYCLEGWYLGDKKVDAKTVFNDGDTIKAKWVTVADHSRVIRNALKNIGMNNADIEKVIKLFSSNSLVGTVFTSEPIWGVVIAALMLGCFAGGLAVGKKKK